LPKNILTVQKVIKTDKLLSIVIEGIARRKGNNAVSLDLSKFENAICDYFVIADAESTTQVMAIADSVREILREEAGLKIWSSMGYENAQWILLDFGDIVVHVFQKPYRDFYNLEGLWADAPLIEHSLV